MLIALKYVLECLADWCSSELQLQFCVCHFQGCGTSPERGDQANVAAWELQDSSRLLNLGQNFQETGPVLRAKDTTFPFFFF